MSYINNEEKMEKLAHAIDELRNKFAKMGIFTYVGVNDANNTSVLYLSIRIDDIAKFVVGRVSEDVKSKIGVNGKVISSNGITYLSLILDLRNATKSDVETAVNNAVKLLQDYANEGISASIIPNDDREVNKVALLISMNDYGNYIIRTALSKVDNKIPVSMVIKSINAESFAGSYIVIKFGREKSRVIG
jgi:hypothetical protein